jgi:hypothetical protein
MSEIKVFISSRDSKCDECSEELGHHAWITLRPPDAVMCLACADLDHLLFLPAGDAALTRRAKKHSTLSAVVLKWSRTRKRYERQGLLVEADALETAEAKCLADEDVRKRRQKRAALKRAELDEGYVTRFARRIRELFPSCPPDRELRIAEHACLEYRGRVGRSTAAKSFDDQAIRSAVIAHVRHAATEYDPLIARGWDRLEARATVAARIDDVLDKWARPQ